MAEETADAAGRLCLAPAASHARRACSNRTVAMMVGHDDGAVPHYRPRRSAPGHGEYGLSTTAAEKEKGKRRVGDGRLQSFISLSTVAMRPRVPQGAPPALHPRAHVECPSMDAWYGRAPSLRSLLSLCSLLYSALLCASLHQTHFVLPSFLPPHAETRRVWTPHPTPPRLRRTSIPARHKTIGPKDTAPSILDHTRRPPPPPTPSALCATVVSPSARLPVTHTKYPTLPHPLSCCFTTASLSSPPSPPTRDTTAPKDPRPSTFRHRPPSAVAVVWTAALHSSLSSAPLGSRIPHQLPTSATTTTTTTTTYQRQDVLWPCSRPPPL
ncbi:uncharacterized protein J3D65DRAFT_600338 [Phyllosticta citribraziliensis]|uniref:Uncharacterized protein n=1 Tax=Phyllosticta citribraziliensis TaxID=989973 RepID=A0ABR1M4T8_9PEZI